MHNYLISMPESLTGSFFKLTGKPQERWMAECDPGGARVGSGGGTSWMLYRAWQQEEPETDFADWLKAGKRIILHAGGQSRRLPAYAPVGKILTPVPVFRWQRGQQINQTLLDIQLPLYERILQQAPAGMHTLVASGDVLITAGDRLPQLSEADVICFGLWISPQQSAKHGVFFCDRQRPETLEFMLQKPSVERIRDLAPDYYFMMDIGIWLLNDRAVKILNRRCGWSLETGGFPDDVPSHYDLYGQFGPAMGRKPACHEPEIGKLTVKILPLEEGAFYHFGTGSDMLQSMLQIQNRVLDQRAIWSRNIKPHPSIFVQNAFTGPFTRENRQIWIENACVPASWKLNSRHILTGIPENNWKLELPEGCCIDMMPVDGRYCLRPYGFTDTFSGKVSERHTHWMEQPLQQWLEKRGISPGDAFSEDVDIQLAPLFPLPENVQEAERLIGWICGNGAPNKELAGRWLKGPRLSAAELSSRADLYAWQKQRETFRAANLPKLADNYRKSVFYQSDLDCLAREWAINRTDLPQRLPDSENALLRIHNRMFRHRVQHYRGENKTAEEQEAFRILREAILDRFRQQPVLPRCKVPDDQIVWGRSPARIDLAGGWTDTPPYCLIEGGGVVNAAVELNRQPPLQVFIKPTEKHEIVLRSIDLGAREVVTSYEQLSPAGGVGTAFAIPRAALMLAGFHPGFCSGRYASLKEQLRDFGGGMEITLLSAIPKGSGLGTSSILAATILGTLADFASLNWDRTEIGNRTLGLEQLLTTGGGWQDQFGGLLPGIKYLQSKPGPEQSPIVRWLPDRLFSLPEYSNSMLLYYTGITRVAKGILAEIVRGMFLNSGRHLDILREMKAHTRQTFEAIQQNNYQELARKIARSWELNCLLDAGTNPPEVQQVISRIADQAAGWKLLGAGGGGYLLILAKDPEAAARIRTNLQNDPPNGLARFVDLRLSDSGFQLSRS
ncbi:MAG: bifunctional fucokinase/fucose-1-phosphate guanylyltransferase [Mangrovibacterium sp.]